MEAKKVCFCTDSSSNTPQQQNNNNNTPTTAPRTTKEEERSKRAKKKKQEEEDAKDNNGTNKTTLIHDLWSAGVVWVFHYSSILVSQAPLSCLFLRYLSVNNHGWSLWENVKHFLHQEVGSGACWIRKQWQDHIITGVIKGHPCWNSTHYRVKCQNGEAWWCTNEVLGPRRYMAVLFVLFVFVLQYIYILENIHLLHCSFVFFYMFN